MSFHDGANHLSLQDFQELLVCIFLFVTDMVPTALAATSGTGFVTAFLSRFGNH